MEWFSLGRHDHAIMHRDRMKIKISGYGDQARIRALILEKLASILFNLAT